MRDEYDVIYAPVITEKTSEQMEINTVYTFIVNKHANKIEIRQAVERIWDGTQKDVLTIDYAVNEHRASRTGPRECGWREGHTSEDSARIHR